MEVDWSARLVSACMKGDAREVDLCLKHCPNLNGAMFYCAQWGWCNIVQSLVKKGATAFYAAFITACRNGHDGTALFLAKFLSPTEIDMGFITGARANRPAVVRSFVGDRSPTAMESAFLWAQHHNDAEMMVFLHDHGVVLHQVIEFD